MIFKAFFILWFCIALNAFSQAVSTPYKIAPKGYLTVAGSEKVVPNMPKVRNQGPAGLCYAFSNATLLQKYYCDDVGIKNCAAVSMDDTISPVAISGFKEALSSQKDPLNGKYDKSAKKTFEQTFLPTYNDDDGGNQVWLLHHTSIQHSYCAESTFSFDQFVGINNFPNLSRYDAHKEMRKLTTGKISELQKIYNKYKSEYLACTDCVKEVKNIIPIDDDRDDLIPRAFKKESFEEFAFALLFKFCNKKVKLTTPTMDYFPKADLTANESEFISNKNHPLKILLINQIKKVVNNNVPLQMVFCSEKKDNKCIGPHVSVITGYKKVCNDKNQCTDMLKIQNSYGMAWQEIHDDGWVSAHDMLNATWGVNKANMIGPGLLSWVSKGPIN